ncbi:MAG: hypothetical protein ACK5MD_06215, partial [Flavobacteriales bacterium]
MKKGDLLFKRGRSTILTVLLWLFVGFSCLYGQVGVGNNAPNGVMDLTNKTSNNTYPLVVPSMSGANAESSVVNPKG